MGSRHQGNCTGLYLSDPGPAPPSLASKNICVNTGLTCDHFLQGTVMKTISEHSYTISQMLQGSWKKTWKCFSATHLYRGSKMWQMCLVKLLEFWKWVKRISCALKVVAAISWFMSAQILALMYTSAAAQRSHKATVPDKQEILLT